MLRNQCQSRTERMLTSSNSLSPFLSSRGIQKEGIQSAVAAASEGDGKQAKSLLAKVCGPAWESVQPVMWPIVGELVKRSPGL